VPLHKPHLPHRLLYQEVAVPDVAIRKFDGGIKDIIA
jgi:hypothetical protein